MGTRLSLGKGFTVGRSGLRYGHSIPGVRRGYLSVGRSGTLITGFRLRHWEPGRRAAVPITPEPAAAGRRPLRHRIALLLVMAAILGFFAVLTRVDADYARTHDSTGQPVPARPRPAVDCATDPHPEYYYACTPTPAIPAPYRAPHG